MCNRYSEPHSREEIIARFHIDLPLFEVEPCFNVPPTAIVPVVTGSTERKLEGMKWGLLPGWAQAKGEKRGWTNARGEDIDKKPAFRPAFEKRRCLIPASGFFEWKQLEHRKQPFYFKRRDGEMFAFAGVWEPLREPAGPARATCAIVTTGANGVMQPIHDRMPVMLLPEDEAKWLDPATSPAEAAKLLRPFPEELMDLYMVDCRVGKADFNEPECIEPMPNSA